MDQNSFTKIAKRILKTQKKLGALKGLKVTPLTISESRKRHLKQAGLYSAASLSAAAIAAAGITLAGKKKKGKQQQDLTPVVYTGPRHRPGQTRTVKDVTPEKKRKFPKVSIPKMSKKTKIVGSSVAAGTALAATGAKLALSKRSTLLIEAKYAYGTKLFEVCSLTEEDLKNGVDKKILREITATVAQLKNAQDWAVKESASVGFLKMAAVAEALVEEVMYTEMLEDEDVEVAATNAAREVSDFDDVEEGFLFEDDEEEDDEEEDDEDLAEAYIFEDEEEEDDEDLAEAYIFEDEDLEEGFLFEDEEEEEEDLAEAYIFED